MTRFYLTCGLLSWAGLTLVLSSVRHIARPTLTERLRPFTPGRVDQSRDMWWSVESFTDVLAPLARNLGGRLSQLVGIGEELEIRLQRIHSPLDVTAFRLRQVGWAGAAAMITTLLAIATGMSAFTMLFCILAAPLLAFLTLEQQLSAASTKRQRRIFLELPVVAEQLGMLLSAGFSLGAAMHRLADRTEGACADDLERVRQRIGQGLSENEALQEWAATAKVPELDRLVAVLALNREAGDLGGLIAEEARSTRRDVQRELVESIERRSQQVWIPVTVATLVPGVIFMAVPFIEAMSAFGTGAP